MVHESPLQGRKDRSVDSPMWGIDTSSIELLTLTNWIAENERMRYNKRELQSELL